MQAWPQPNLVNPPSIAYKLLAWEIPLFGLSLVFVTLRIYAKRVYTKYGLGVEDWLMLAATVTT